MYISRRSALHGLMLAIPTSGRAQQQVPTKPAVQVSISPTDWRPLEPGFAGYNSPLMDTGLKGSDPRLISLATKLHPGWLKYPAGTRTNAFDWNTGQYRLEWVDRVEDPNVPGELRNGYQILSATGPQTIVSADSLAKSTGAVGLIVQVNVFSDTPESAGKFAAYTKEHGIKVLVWQLGTEPTFFPKVFPTAAAYANKVKPFGDAIKAVDPNAKISLSLGIVRAPGYRFETEWDDGLAAYRPRYWDVLTYHQYPRVRGSDAELMAMLNEALLLHTTKHVTDYVAPRFGDMPLIITESDPGSPLPQRPDDLGAAVILRPGTSMVGTLYGGIWSAEYVLRLSSLPQMKHVGIHHLTGPAGVQVANAHRDELLAAYRENRTVDTRSLDYGLFVSATGAAYAVATSAINSASRVYNTSLAGGGVAPLPGGRSMPALYAQAYGNGRDFSVVITNKGEAIERVSIISGGRPVNARFRVLTATGPGPSERNALDKETVSGKSSETSGPILIPPFSVVRISW